MSSGSVQKITSRGELLQGTLGSPETGQVFDEDQECPRGGFTPVDQRSDRHAEDHSSLCLCCLRGFHAANDLSSCSLGLGTID